MFMFMFTLDELFVVFRLHIKIGNGSSKEVHSVFLLQKASMSSFAHRTARLTTTKTGVKRAKRGKLFPGYDTKMSSLECS